MAELVSSQTMNHILELERELQMPATRVDQDRLDQLLAPDFIEIGASGRCWDRDSTLAMLTSESTSNGDEVIEVTALHGRPLAPDFVQVSGSQSALVDVHAARRSGANAMVGGSRSTTRGPRCPESC